MKSPDMVSWKKDNLPNFQLKKGSDIKEIDTSPRPLLPKLGWFNTPHL
jgi:hypothetical protein